MHIVHNSASKTVTIITDTTKVEVTAAKTLNFCQRKDGIVTVWFDGKPAKDTIRVGKEGILNGKATKGRKPASRKVVAKKAS